VSQRQGIEQQNMVLFHDLRQREDALGRDEPHAVEVADCMTSAALAYFCMLKALRG